MKKEEIIYENNLKPGMIFENCRKAIEFIGYKYKNHTNQALDWLSHYCNYIRNNDYTIVIKEIYNPIIPFKDESYHYKIDELITVNTGSYKIIDRYKDGNKKYYKCKCEKDGYEFDLMEKRITFGLGCPICGNRKRINGINTYDILRPDLVKYFVNSEDLKTAKSTDYVLCKCPECKKEREILMSNLCNYGFTCNYCSDGISYPNKFIRNFLQQLNINYIPEKSFDWSKGRIYDEYLPEYNLIIENHGRQHYEDLGNSVFSKLEYQQCNDWFKRGLAIQNQIKNYIELDCRKSTKEWIKKSIMESNLPNLLNFCEQDINWEQCDLFATSNNEIIKNVCNDWEKNKNQSLLSKKYKLHISTIRKYLEIGSKCGYCDYTKGVITSDNIKRTNDFHCKPIKCIELNLYFYSKNECGEYFKNKYEKFPTTSLYVYINKNKKYKNLTFKYVTKEEFNNNKKINPTICFGEYYCEDSIIKEKEKING